jgi:Fe-S cluster assembly protein SufD
MTTDVMDAKDLFLSHFSVSEKRYTRRSKDGLDTLRSAAMERFAELGLPTLHDEEWRFTPLTALTSTPFELADSTTPGLTAEDVERLLPPTGPALTIVLINGRFMPQFSPAATLPEGAYVGSLAAALGSVRERIEPHLAKIVQFDDAPFVALNSAFLRDGLCVYLPRGTALQQPLHLVSISVVDGEPVVFHPRTLIVCENGSRATVVQSYLSAADRPPTAYFANAVTEIVLGNDARLDHCKLQRESNHGLHFETLHIQQNRGSHFSSQAISLGGALVRNEINATLAAEGCECTLNGLYVAGGTQHMDNRTSIDHAMPRCTSHELYKGILDGKAKGVFNGKIYVRQDAQKTDAKQTNKTLLLSDDATINTKPQLEIFADDVKCTHGATVGQLAEDAIFYLRARGLGLEEARALLTFAFANDILQRITVEPLRRQLEESFLAAQRLPAERNDEEA